MGEIGRQDAYMLERWSGVPNLIDVDEYWADVLAQYRLMDVALPIELNQQTVTDLLREVKCPPGCGDCCRHYKRVGVGPADVARIKHGTGRDISPYLSHDNQGDYLSLAGGCHFLENNRCSIYQHRPDCCAIFPIQHGRNCDSEGQWSNTRLYVRIECSVVVQAIRSMIRRILSANPGSVLLPNLGVKVTHG